MRIKAAFRTDRGRVKPNNEDSGGIFFGGSLLVVADGMGGGQAGEYASRQAVAQIHEVVTQSKFYVDGQGVKEEGAGRTIGGKGMEAAVQHANTFLHSMSKAQEVLQGMGTTAVCCLIEGGIAHFGNVGDSRGYILRRGVLRQVTRDHSLFSDPKFEKTNVITRALGRKSYVEVDLFEEPLEAGDVLLLASDGLDKVVPDEAIARELCRDDASCKEVAERLVELANQGGGPDNITALVARIEGRVEKARPASDSAVAKAPRPNRPPAPAVSRDEITDVRPVGELPTAEELDRVPKPPPPAEEPPPMPSDRPRGRRVPRAVWLAVALVLLLVPAAMVWLTREAAPRGPLLLVELRGQTGGGGAAWQLALVDGAATTWAATAQAGANGGLDLRVTQPPDLVGRVSARTGDELEVALPTGSLTGLELRVDGAGGQQQHVLQELWHVGSGAYRLTLTTAAYSQARAAVWRDLAEQRSGGNSLQALLDATGSVAAGEEEKTWVNRCQAAWREVRDAARGLDETLAAPGRVSASDLAAQHRDMMGRLGRLEGLAPPGVEPLREPAQVAALLEHRQRFDEVLGALEAAAVARDDLERALAGAARAEVQRRLRALEQVYDQAKLLPDEEAAALMRRAQAAASRTARAPTPVPRPTAVSPSATERAAAAALGSLKKDLEDLQSRFIGQASPGPDFRNAVLRLRARVEELLAPSPPASDTVRQAWVEASNQWLIFENWVSTYHCRIKPAPAQLALLERLTKAKGVRQDLARRSLESYAKCLG